jgi:hypothetical protein
MFTSVQLFWIMGCVTQRPDFIIVQVQKKKQGFCFFDQVTETLCFLLEPSFSSHAVHLTIYRNNEKGMAHY